METTNLSDDSGGRKPMGHDFRKAFTRIEMVLVIAVALVLVMLSVVGLRAYDRRSKLYQCLQNQREIRTVYWTSKSDGNGSTDLLSNSLPTRPFLLAGQITSHFRAMSNYLGSTKLLICPADVREAATMMDTLQKDNISYFVGPDASERYPYMLLSGDRNIQADRAPANSILTLEPNSHALWTKAIHREIGIVFVGDGSAQRTTTESLRKLVDSTTDCANWIVLPD